MVKAKNTKTIPIYFESPLYEEALRTWGESRGINSFNAAVRMAIIEATNYGPLREYAKALEAVRSQRFQTTIQTTKSVPEVNND